MRRAEKEGGGSLCRGGRAESELGEGAGREREPQEEVKAEEGSIHGNKWGLREIRLPESEFVCNNNTIYSLSLRSLGRVGGGNWELEWEKLGGSGEGWTNSWSCERGVGAWGGG